MLPLSLPLLLPASGTGRHETRLRLRNRRRASQQATSCRRQFHPTNRFHFATLSSKSAGAREKTCYRNILVGVQNCHAVSTGGDDGGGSPGRSRGRNLNDMAPATPKGRPSKGRKEESAGAPETGPPPSLSLSLSLSKFHLFTRGKFVCGALG